MKIRTFYALALSSLLVLGTAGCAAEAPPAETPENVETVETEENDNSNDTGDEANKSSASPIDRTKVSWNDTFPADFPLEDIPFPTEGTFDYAELVEDDVWNVMISDIPHSVNAAWDAEMSERFNSRDDDGYYYTGYAPSGIYYSINSIVFDEDADAVTMAYRISIID